MAGINRLGKAPPKPGSLRPPDPNKYRTVDMFSEGAEGDMDYIKTVRDIEEMQQQQGWLFGRGAFDKADLLYLRDTMEQQRHIELELRDNERSQFASLRARLDKDDPRAAGSSAAPRPAKRDREPTIKVQPKLKPVVVAKKGQDIGARGTPTAADAQHALAAGPSDKKRRAEEEDKHGNDQDVRGTAPDNAAGPSADSDEADGLVGLLGGYGSDSDSSSDDDGPGPAAAVGAKGSPAAVGSNAAGVSLPGAADLLDSSRPMDSTLPKVPVDTRPVWTLPESPSSD